MIVFLKKTVKARSKQREDGRKAAACSKSLRALTLEKLVFKFECDKVKQNSCYAAYMTKNSNFLSRNMVYLIKKLRQMSCGIEWNISGIVIH